MALQIANIMPDTMPKPLHFAASICLVIISFHSAAAIAYPLTCSPTQTPHEFLCVTDTRQYHANWNGSDGTQQVLYILTPEQQRTLSFLPLTAEASFYGRESFWVKAIEYNNWEFTCQWWTAGSGKPFGPGGYVHGYCYIRATDLK